MWYIFYARKIYFIPVYRSVNTLMERHSLDRRRLEHAHFQYALLRVFSWYNFDLPKYPLHEATHETLIQVTGTYYGAFMKKYSGKLPIFICEGLNQKNTLPVCLYLLLSVVFWRGIFGVKYFLHFQLHIQCNVLLLNCLNNFHDQILSIDQLIADWNWVIQFQIYSIRRQSCYFAKFNS